ncbi:MAG: NAD(P)/FAD-dependent oxidoreductase [Chloroflexi bacterium]|nr:NAD(P)/FAD-dependent oxidoreductase [Chloroflexota bacterium]
MTETFDIAIIGAGIVGLAVAEALAVKGRRLVVMEKNDAFGQETSSRNSEVIHAGLYYPKVFLKSSLCIEGNRLLYKWCKKHHVPHQRIGKFIVATNEEECADLERIGVTAEENGVEALEFLGRMQIKSLDPEITALEALFSKNTGIVDSHRLMQTLLARAEDKGAILTCRAEVTAIHFNGATWDININDGEYRVITKTLINSAGLHADRIAALAGIDIDESGYRLKPCKGNYFTATPAPKINHLIYPVPVKNNIGLGIHTTLDLSGRVRFGPDSQYMSTSQPLDYAVDESLKPVFYESIKRYLPGVPIDALNPDMSGIRPKIQGPGDPVMDFIIREESERGLPGLVNLIGIESPGLTACLAIGAYINKIVSFR